MASIKKIAMWTGIALTGLCGIVLVGGGKIQSGALLIITAFVMTLLVGRNKLPIWARVVLLCAVYGVVIANISTTELPSASDGITTQCSDTAPVPSTGFRFLDQMLYIFNGFLSQAAPS